MEYLILLLIYFAMHLGLWPLFEKAGKPGWHSAIPLLQDITWLEIIGRKKWTAIFGLVPFLNFVFALVWISDTLNSFNQRKFWQYLVSIFFGFLYFPILGIDKKVRYAGPSAINDKKNNVKKSTTREWADAIIFAVIAASIIRMFGIEAYKIPSGSMEGTLMTGDFLFVSKFHYGPRVPMTPVAFPFAHHTMPITKTKAYWEGVKLKYHRLPGFQNIKRNDAVVFNFPEGDTVIVEFQSNESYYSYKRRLADQLKARDLSRNLPVKSEDQYQSQARKNIWEDMNLTIRPIDKKENFIKRCVGMPGDILEIKDAQVYINDKEGWNPPNAFNEYIGQVKGGINKRILERLNIQPNQIQKDQFGSKFVFNVSYEQAEALKKLKNITRFEQYIESSDNLPYNKLIYPNNESYKWSSDQFGPIEIPAKGATIQLTPDNWPIYERVINTYENNNTNIDTSGSIYINGEKVSDYTFKMNYYFMMGDNRHHSADSRYWGFVPEDHIVGKPLFVWLSLNPNKSFPRNIEWKRMFASVHGKRLN